MIKMNKKGFSLVEVLAAVSIFSFIMVALFSSFSAGNVTWVKMEANVLTQGQVRLALINLTKELREGEDIDIVQNANSVVLTFTRSINDLLQTVTYSWDNSGADANRLIRQDLSGSRIIASNISAFTLTEINNSVIVNLTASKTSNQGGTNNFNLQGKVALR